MKNNTATKTVSVRVIKQDLVEWKKLDFIQPEKFKSLSKDNKERLKQSILSNGFSDHFRVWEPKNGRTLYCLDGKHRSIVLREMEKEGIAVPEKLPANFIYCENKHEAAKAVLLFSSIYAEVTASGFQDFAKMYTINVPMANLEFAIPGINMPSIMGLEQESKDDGYVPPDDIKTNLKPGDLIEIGPHRLLCGDSTIKEDVERVLAGKEPYLMVTDPPYGVEYDPTWRHKAGINESARTGKVSNDGRSDWTDTWKLSPASVAYIWHADRHASTVQISLESASFDVRAQIIWNKQQMVFSRGDYHWKHEPCWYAVKKGCKGNWAGDRKQTTVWDIQSILQSAKSKKEDEAQVHGTQKPVECMARPIRNHDGDVYDPFLGSGTTMVAAHQLSRKCYGLEIDPKYCQVIIDRLSKLDPSLKVKVNGKPLSISV